MNNAVQWQYIMNVFTSRVLIFLGIVAVVVWFGVIEFSGGAHSFSNSRQSNELRVTFLDVGQGDGIFIETATGIQVLIDGGPDATVIRRLGTVMRPWDRTIDMVVATHPDKDHVAGLVDVLDQYQVKTILTTENRGETMVATAYHTAMIREPDATIWYARAGQIIALDASTTLAIFSPADNPALLESNASSIILQLRYGDIEFMFTGDAPQGVEDYLVRMYGTELLESEVLKLGHHGSQTATSELFLSAVQPRYGVVSASIDNSYGHPHPDVVARVTAEGVSLVSTAELGTITFVSDGVEVWPLQL